MAEVARTPFEVVLVRNDRHNCFLTRKKWAENLESVCDEVVTRVVRQRPPGDPFEVEPYSPREAAPSRSATTTSGSGDSAGRWSAAARTPRRDLHGRAEVEMDAGPRLHNAMGILHGGVPLDLADVAMGVALATVAEEGETFSTVQSSVSYLRPVTEGRLVADARVVHRGRTAGHMECEVRDGKGRATARVSSVLAIRETQRP